MSVFANSKSIVHAGDGLKFVAAAPDVCKTPSPGGPIPVPYPNFAMSSDLGDGTKTVKIEGKSVAVKGAKLKTSTGDEAGTAGGGIVSSKTKGAVKWLSCSMNVKFEGKGVILFLTPTMHNGNMSNVPGFTAGQIAAVQALDIETQCVHCGKPLEHKSHKFFDTLNSDLVADANLRSKSQSAKTVGLLEMSDKKRPSFEVAGSADRKLFNLQTGAQIPVSKTQLDGYKKMGNEVGNCTEQKLLRREFIAGGSEFPLKGRTMKMGIANAIHGNAKKEKRKTLKKAGKKPCGTCEKVLVAMLCTNDPIGEKKGNR